MEIVKFTYDKIASKLSSYVSQSKKIRVIMFFSSFDQGRDRANLSILKCFGVVPEEHDISKGDSVFNILSGLNGFDGLVIIIESVDASRLLLKDTVVQNEHCASVSRISSIHQHLINKRTEKISNFFKHNKHEYTAGHVYISGFSVSISSTSRNSLPDAGFMPWYLEIDNKPGLSRIVRQPELNFLLNKTTEMEPLIYNLDDYLNKMSDWESKLAD